MPRGPESSTAARKNSSLEMNWSPRVCAALSLRLSRRFKSAETVTLPSGWPMRGRVSRATPNWLRSALALMPACSSRAVMPSVSSRASARCVGSMAAWSRPTARLWASESACWKRLVSLSMRMGFSGSVAFAIPPMWVGAGGIQALERVAASRENTSRLADKALTQ